MSEGHEGSQNELQIRAKIREKLEELIECSYEDGSILFNTSICTPDEALELSSSGMVNALATRQYKVTRFIP